MRKVRAATISTMLLLGMSWLTPSAPASAAADTQPPTTPTNLRQTDATANTVRLAWDPSTDDSGAVRYRLRKDTSIVFDGTLSETRAFIFNLDANSGFGFEVRAEDPSGNVSDWSAPVGASTGPPDTIPPAPPSNLRVVGKTSSTVTLAWDPSPSDNPGGEGLLGYWVLSSNGATHGTAETTHTMAGFAPGPYRFTVAALDAAYPLGNQSAPTNEVTVTFP